MAANRIKGLTVEIGGDTTKLGKALENVNKKSRDLSQELGQINKMLKLDPGNADLLAQKQKVLAEAVANTKEKLDTLKKAEKQVQKQFEKGEVSEDQVRELQREIIATTKKMDSYEKAAEETAKAVDNLGDESEEVKDGAKDVKKGADQAADSLDDFAESAEKADKASGNLGSKLGGALVTGLKATGAAAAAAVGGMTAASVSAAGYADDMLTMSSVTGVSTEDLQAFSYAAELVDVDLETLTKSMAKNVKSMSGAASGSKAYADAYAQLGVSVTDSNGNLRDGETVYWEAIDALGKMTNETERDAIAMQLFGKSAQELNPMIEAGAGKMKELTQEARDVGAVMSDESLEALGSFDDSLQRLKGSAGAAKNSLGGVLLPELQLVTDTGTDLLNKFTLNLNKSGGGLDGFVETLGGMSGEITSKLTGLVSQVLQKVAGLAPTLVQIGMGLITSLATSLISMLPQLVQTGIQMITAILNGLTTAIPQIVQALVDMIPQLVQALVTGIPQLIQGAVQLLLAIVQAIPQLLPPLIAALPQIVLAIINGLLTAIPQLIQGAVQFLMAIIQAIPQIIAALVPQIPTIVSAIVDGLLQNIPVLIEGAIQLFMAILQAVPQIIKELIKVGPQLVAGLVKGLIQGIPKVIEGVMDLGKKMLDAIKDFFGIHSPSTVFADIGKNLIAGLVNGVKNIGTALWNAISGAVQKVATWGQNLIAKAKEAGSKFLSSVVSFFQQLPGKIWSFLSNAISKVTTWASNMVSKAKTAASNFLNSVVSFFKQLPGKIWGFLSNAISKVASWGSSLVSKAKAGVQKMVTAVTNTVKQLPSKMAEAGKNLVQGLWKGISGSYTWLKNKIKGWVGNVTDFLKKLFGINSPSKVTAWMGEMLDEGFAVGIEDNTDSPLQAMSKLSEGLLDEADSVNGLTLSRQINHTFGAANTAAATGTDMLGKLDQILIAIERGQVIALDGDTLVGSTAARYDSKLGQRRVLAARGAL